jgi:hypothetical protein
MTVLTDPIKSISIQMLEENEKAADFQVEYPELWFMLDETFRREWYATEAVRTLLERFSGGGRDVKLAEVIRGVCAFLENAGLSLRDTMEKIVCIR